MEAVEAAGGTVRRGSLGEVEVALPARLYPSNGDGVDWGAGLVEVEMRKALAIAAEVVVSGHLAVAAALDELEADRSKEPKQLSQRLEDKSPTLAGGV